MKQRSIVVPQAHGRVLEIGIGSGLNFGFYDASKVDHLFGLEPSLELSALAGKQTPPNGVPLELIQGIAEQIPMEDNSVDSIVITFTMCTIPELPAAFSEMRRVLKPHGELLFCEHGAAPDKSVQRWQNRLNPIWKKFAGGCNLNRKIPALIQEGGFRMENLETKYIPGFKPVGFIYWGMAKPR